MKALELKRGFVLTGSMGDMAFKASVGWCVQTMKRAGLTLRHRTTFARLPAEYAEKLISFQRHGLIYENNNYLLGQITNADQMPIYFDMLSNVTVDNKGTKSVPIKTTRITVMLGALADGRKLPPYVILRRKTMPKEDLPKGLVFRCQSKGWMINNLMLDRLKVVWNQRPGALLKKSGMLMLDSFRGHITPEVKEQVS